MRTLLVAAAFVCLAWAAFKELPQWAHCHFAPGLSPHLCPKDPTRLAMAQRKRLVYAAWAGAAAAALWVLASRAP